MVRCAEGIRFSCFFFSAEGERVQWIGTGLRFKRTFSQLVFFISWIEP